MKIRPFFFGTMACLTAGSANAQSTWDNGAATGLWNTAANWDPDGIPAGAVQFTNPGLTSVLIDGATGYAAGNLTFGNGSTFLIGNSTGDTANINLSGRTVTISDTGTYTINLGNGTGTNDASTGRLNLNNTTFSVAEGGRVILDGRYTSESGAVRTITKSGTGALQLSGNFFGNFMTANVTAGTLELNSGGANRRLNGLSGISEGAVAKVTSAGTQLATGSTGFFTTLGINSVAGTFDLNGFNTATGNLSGAASTGVVTNSGAADATLTVGSYGNRAGMSDRSSSFAGILSDGPTRKLGLTVNSQTGTSPIYRLTLTGNSTHSGQTTVSAGILRLLGGNISNSTLVLGGAGRLQVGDGTVTLGSASTGAILQDGTSAIELDLTPGACDQITAVGSYTYTAGSIEVAVNNAASITSGSSFTLASYGSLSGSPVVNFTGLAGSPLIPTVNYGTGSNSAITVTFNLPPAGQLLWTGATDSTWTIGGPANWSNGGSPVAFALNDKVTFDDSAPVSRLNPNLDAQVQPLGVTFANNSKAYTLGGTGAITGTSTVTKSGTGTVTITTNNTHVGTNTISAGTLRVGSGGTSGSLGTGEVVNEAQLEFNRSDLLTVANLISGGGSISKTGAGTTVLTAENTYLGTTTVSSGTLQVGDGGITGSLGETSGILDNGTLAFNRDGTLTVTPTITGTGSLVQNGPGTVILTSDSTYGGGTTINAGTLQLGNGDVFGSVTGSIVNNGNLTINRVDDLNFATPVSGTGSLTQAGIGALRLTGTKTYTGETRIAQGILDLDSGSKLPVGGAFAFIGGNGTLRILDAALTSLSGFRSVGPGGGSNLIESSSPLTVTGGDLLVGPNVDASHFLDLGALPSFTYTVPGNVVSIGSQAPNGGARSVTMVLPDAATFTASSINLQTVNGATPTNTTAAAAATLELGATTTFNADTLNMGFSRDHASIVQAFDALDPTLKLRATDGTGRMNINMGGRSTAYGPTQNVSIDLLTNVSGTATLDAQVGTLKIGDYARGSGQIQNATFQMGDGTLDANEIILGNIYNNNGNNGVLNATLTVQGGDVIAPTVNFGSRSNGVLNSTLNLRAGATLKTGSIFAGTGVANRVLNLGTGTLSNTPGEELGVSGIKVLLETQSAAALTVSAGNQAFFGQATNFEFRYDSSLAEAGTLTITGNAEIDASTVLTLADDIGTPAPMSVGQKLVLIQYPSGTFTGNFCDASSAPIADGAVVTVGSQSFTIDYNDPAYAGKAVTLTASAGGSTYASWAAVNAGGGLPDADFDRDGVPNAVEYFMGQTGSTFTPNPGPVAGKVTWPKSTTAQASYVVQTSTALTAEGTTGGWETVSSGVVDTGTSVEYSLLPTTGPKRFVRLKVTTP